MRKTSMPRTIIRSGDLPPCKCCVGNLRERGTLRPAWFAALSERDMRASPADGHEAAKTGNDARRSIRWIRAFAGLWKRSPPPGPEGAPALPAVPEPGSGRAPVFETARATHARGG